MRWYIMGYMGHDQSTTGERLRHLRTRKGYSAEKLAKAVGRSVSAVLRQERDERGISPSLAKTYARLLQTTPDEILYGKDFNQVTVNTTINTHDALAPIAVPLLSCRDIEQFRSIASGAIPMSESVVFAPNNLNASKRLISVKAEDKSMECGGKENISEGDHVFIDPEQSYAAGDIVAAVAPGFDTLIFRKYRVTSFGDDGSDLFDLIPFNPDFPSVLEAHAKNVIIVGRVVGAFRTF
jgi:SOS-response transcriptional repressor LexA